MNHTITTNLEYWVYNFLEQQAKATKKTKKSIIEDALKLYQKYQLKVQIESWLNERYDEYKDLNNDFLETQINSIKI
jgi:phage anti-repressor protein